METVKDPLTGEPFHKRRSNQKFSSRENQIRYNNFKGGQKRKAKAQVDKILDKNRNILKKVLGEKKEVILSKDYLLGAGFHFSCLTHNIKIGETIYNCIYDFCYARLENNQYKIVPHATND